VTLRALLVELGIKEFAAGYFSQIANSFGGFPARGALAAEVLGGFGHLGHAVIGLLRRLAFVRRDFLGLALFLIRFVLLLADEVLILGRSFLAFDVHLDLLGLSDELLRVGLHFRYPALHDARFDVVRFGFDVFVEQIFSSGPPRCEEFNIS
jgi:hypothetical protein